MAKRKQQQQPVKKEKVKRQREEALATAGGFFFMGAYVLITKDIPSTMIGWGKFIGMYVLVAAILYAIFFFIMRKGGNKN